jgi:DNA-binding response OmpR family regulator
MNASRILIIDDEIEVCLLLSHYLSKKNWEVEYATTIAEGMEIFQRIKPPVIILDNNLPDGYGIDNIGIFREFDPDVIVILMSARSDLKEDALERGANIFMEKPISFAILNTFLEEQEL